MPGVHTRGEPLKEDKEMLTAPLFEACVAKPSAGAPTQGEHDHRCMAGGCKEVWRHGDECADNEEAHTCKRCGTQQWWVWPEKEEHKVEVMAAVRKFRTEDVARFMLGMRLYRATPEELAEARKELGL